MTILPHTADRSAAQPVSATEPVIITVNGGSSSIKVSIALASATHPHSPPNVRLFTGVLERIGTPAATLSVRTAADKSPLAVNLPAATFEDALAAIVDALKAAIGNAPVLGIGHRIVHGGLTLLDHQLITPAVLAALNLARPLDLAHLPREIALIDGFAAAFPAVPKIACFDTAFHRDMPRVAQLLPIPRRYFRDGLRRFGFHGLSYTSLMKQLAQIAGAEAASGRVILAHLGSGASMAAVHRGKPIDTTMSFTPMSGLVMGTRPGDLDPGLLIYLLTTGKLSIAQLDDMLNTHCGLLGVSETSADMRDLLAARGPDARAAEAIDLFCAQARKHLCALAGTLGGVDTIIFSGGIGEHCPEVRAAICDGLEFLGVTLDSAKNAAMNPADQGIISAENSGAHSRPRTVTIRVIPTDEESVMVDVVRSLHASASKSDPPAACTSVAPTGDEYV